MPLTLEKINQQLKLAVCRVRIERISNKLYLRGTFPPKPNSKTSDWKQQRISLSLNANEAGLQQAKAIAFEVSASLERGTFSWNRFLKGYSEQGIEVKTAIDQFEEQYFQSRKKTPTTIDTFKKHYLIYFRRLPFDSVLTKSLLLDVLKETDANSYTRHACYLAFNSLSKVVLEEELGYKELKGIYRDEAVDPQDLPDDQTIEETRDFIINPTMEVCYILMAIYGLRPSECFQVDENSLRSEDGVILALTTKTKGKPYWRPVYPSRFDWVEKWQVPRLYVPTSNASTNGRKGATITKFFKRHPQINFTAYKLRHAYAARLASKNVDSAVAAKWMGHSSSLHTRVYHKFLDRRHFDAVYEKYIKP